MEPVAREVVSQGRQKPTKTELKGDEMLESSEEGSKGRKSAVGS